MPFLNKRLFGYHSDSQMHNNSTYLSLSLSHTHTHTPSLWEVNFVCRIEFNFWKENLFELFSELKLCSVRDKRSSLYDQVILQRNVNFYLKIVDIVLQRWIKQRWKEKQLLFCSRCLGYSSIWRMFVAPDRNDNIYKNER